MNATKFLDSAKNIKNPLGIIALFIALIYGFSSSVVIFGPNGETNSHIVPLIYFLIFFPVIVFLGFLWLVAKHPEKLYGPSDFENDDNFIKFIKSSLESATLLTAAAITNSDEKTEEQWKEQLNNIVNLFSEATPKLLDQNWENRILWVDDRPDNNLYERRAFEAQGLQVDLALSTNDALDKLKDEKFALIISDMGRKEGPQEGYVLLDKIRNSGNHTPFVIYAGSNLPEHRRMARDHGALDSTNSPEHLFRLVMNTVNDGF